MSSQPTHTRFYRDKLNGKLAGVCAGMADYTGIDALWIRIATVLLSFHGIGIVAYGLIAWLAPVKPAGLYADREEQRFWQGVRQSPTRSAREVRGAFRELDRRLAAVEAHYVTNNPRLADEIENLR